MIESTQPTLKWSVRPASLHPKKAAFASSLIVIVGALMVTSDLLLGILAVCVLIATQATFFFPSTFSIDADGIRAKYPIQRKYYRWSQVRRVMFGKDSCCFFTRKKPSTLDGFSGLPVLYGAKRDEIEAVIKQYLPEKVTEVRFSSRGVA